MKKKALLHIGGMTCLNCQNKIEKELNHTDGVVRAVVNYSDGTAEIEYNEEKISIQEMEAVIERLDYKVLHDRKKQVPDIIRIACLLIIIVALYAMLQSMGILNLLVPGQLADSGMGYGMLFVIGLITSVHCIAMCGGINLSQCIPQGDVVSESKGKINTLRPAVLYNLGRIVSYTAMGFVFGLMGFLIGGGTEVGISVFFQGLLKILAGMFMVIMGVNMLGIFPALRKFTIRMPAPVARKIGAEKTKSNRPFYIGILNGFMPCGPLQSMWIVALASENPFTGALSMFLFSLGTVPLMLGLGSIVSVLGKKFTDQVMTVGAVLVTVLGLAMLSQGGSLSGWLPSNLLLILVVVLSIVGFLQSLPVENKEVKSLIKVVSVVLVAGTFLWWNNQELFIDSSESEASVNEAAGIVDGVQVVYSTLELGKYPNITVQAGIPVKWVIDAPKGSINGCNYKIFIRDLNLEYTFATGENIIEFTPEKEGTIRYSCWMGMIRGNIFVTDGTEDSVPATGDVTEPTPSGYSIPVDHIAVAVMKTDAQGNQIQEVSIRLTDEGFEPAVVVVQKEITTVWNIEVDLKDNSTGIDLLAPYYSTILSLSNGENELSLYPTEDFDIATGDYQSFAYLKVVDDIENVNEADIQEEVARYDPLIYPENLYAGSGMSCCY